MNIIIVGDGKVGYTLAQYLSQENHDVTVVDNNKDNLTKAVETLDVMSVRGNGANVETLLNAGADTADMVIAVTTNDETNMVCCLAAKQLGAKYTIARIRNPEHTQSMNLLMDRLSIDYVINPENVAAYEISRLLRYPFAVDIEAFARGRVEMVEFRVKQGDPIIGRTLVDFRSKNPGVLYIAAERDGEVIIPDGKFMPQADDRLFVLSELATLTEYFKRLGRSTQRIRSAIIIGGS
ncbi:MAG: NAD-binding protein, partial [Eubacteriales bacterium]|nr:NAD-binding protein [Eubacteriales bacterium]